MQVHAVARLVYQGSISAPAPAPEPAPDQASTHAPRRAHRDDDRFEPGIDRRPEHARARRRGHFRHHGEIEHTPRSHRHDGHQAAEGGGDMGEAKLDIRIKLHVASRPAPSDEQSAESADGSSIYVKASIKIRIKGDLSALLSPPPTQPPDPMQEPDPTETPTGEAPATEGAEAPAATDPLADVRDQLNGSLDAAIAKLDGIKSALVAVREALNGLFDAVGGLVTALTGAPESETPAPAEGSPTDEPVDEAPAGETPEPVLADPAVTELPAEEAVPTETTDPTGAVTEAPADEAEPTPAAPPAIADVFAQFADQLSQSLGQITQLIGSIFKPTSGEAAPTLRGSLDVYLRFDVRSTLDVAA